jgi:hypothetical protein
VDLGVGWVSAMALSLALNVSAPATAAAPSPSAPGAVARFFVGEGWGCLMLPSPTGPTWHCWRAPGEPAATVHARHVPWMDGYPQFSSGADRICIPGTGELTCYRPPDSFDHDTKAAADFVPEGNAAHYGLSGARKTTWKEAEVMTQPPLLPWNTLVGPSPIRVTVGGTFDCWEAFVPCNVYPPPRNTGAHCLGPDDTSIVPGPCTPMQWGIDCPTNPQRGVSCLGSLKFGEIGAPKGGRVEPPLADLAVGTWHACGRTLSGDVVCWGRDDHGQLGFPPPEPCDPLGDKPDCAPAPRKVPFAFPAPTVLRAGDLFTCTPGARRRGVICWGANRDGFFGARGSCDAELSKAWPTMAGSVPPSAPACASRPVAAPALRGLTIDEIRNPDLHDRSAPLDYSVGSRGVCVVHGARVRCAGAIASPRAAALSHVRVSSGQDASACALTGGHALVCWGEGYSPRDRPDEPVVVEAEPLPANSDAAATDYGRTGPHCLVHKPCYAKVKPPRCEPAVVASARTWDDLSPYAEAFAGEIVQVRGSMELGHGAASRVGCGAGDCCNFFGAGVILGGTPPVPSLLIFGCAGDESRSCCPVAPHGEVVAKGRLVKGQDQTIWPWRLADVDLCLVAP